MKKSVNQIAAVMCVLIAGFSYLPIDIKQPLARQEKILSKANVIVELDEKKVNMILQNLEYRLEKHPEFQNPIAYVIFTSGSTGEPKGVVMSHTAAQNTLKASEKAFIWVRQNKGNDSRCIYFEGKNPSVLTGEILAITANAIFEMPRKDGIYTMASYLEKYQVLDELKKIDKFKSEGKI